MAAYAIEIINLLTILVCNEVERVNWRIQTGSFGLLIYRETTICDEYA